MRKSKFKIGDKVKVTYMNLRYKGSTAWDDNGKDGKIVKIWDDWDDADYNWPIRVKIGKCERGFNEEELTLMPIAGKQLLFNFME